MLHKILDKELIPYCYSERRTNKNKKQTQWVTHCVF